MAARTISVADKPTLDLINASAGASTDTASQTGASLQAKVKYLANTSAIMALDITTIKNATAGGGVSALTIRITCAAGLTGTLTITGDGNTLTAPVNTSTPVDVVVATPNIKYKITCGNYAAECTIGAMFGIYPTRIGDYSIILADNTWAKISAASKAGVASSLWNIGDTINVAADGGAVAMQIYDFGHDDIPGGGRAGITFGTQNLKYGTRQMETSNINTNGFFGSAMYAYLSTTLLTSLPTDLQAVLLNVNKKTSAGNQSTTINTNAMKIFLFSEIELFGAKTCSVDGEGFQYPIFTDNNSRIKKLSNGTSSAYIWWLRSPYASSAAGFCVVGTSGAPGSGSASGAFGVCFGFCV